MAKTLTREQILWRWRILAATYVGYAGYYLTRKAFTICKKPIAETLGWELGDTAYIWAAFLIAYMIGQFVNGFIGRKWGPRVTLLGGLGVSIVCAIIFGLANSFSTFLVFMFINGLVQATGWPGCVGAVSSWLRPSERGRIMGFWCTQHIVGNIAYKWIGGMFLGTGGLLLGFTRWRWCFIGLSVITIAVWWLLYIWQRDKPEDVGLDPIVDDQQDAGRAMQASQETHVTLMDYLRIMANPLIFCMGVGYFFIKYLRYALDSWLPAFLSIQGLTDNWASYYSMIFDFAGVAGTILAGFALSHVFRNNWAKLCFFLSIGVVAGCACVIQFGTTPLSTAICFGLVGFMVYGPDSILTGAAAIAVAGETNAIAVAGIVNGIGSIGPVVQELVIGKLMRGDQKAGIATSNWQALYVSIALAFMMLVVTLLLRRAHRQYATDMSFKQAQN